MNHQALNENEILSCQIENPYLAGVIAFVSIAAMSDVRLKLNKAQRYSFWRVERAPSL